MNKIILSTILASAIFSTGCASVGGTFSGYQSGTQVTEEQQNTFSIGKTTETELVKALGSPQQRQSIDGNIHCIYEYTEINHVSANKSESKTFIFGKNGRLTDIQSGAGSNKNPLLGG